MAPWTFAVDVDTSWLPGVCDPPNTIPLHKRMPVVPYAREMTPGPPTSALGLSVALATASGYPYLRPFTDMASVHLQSVCTRLHGTRISIRACRSKTLSAWFSLDGAPHLSTAQTGKQLHCESGAVCMRQRWSCHPLGRTAAPIRTAAHGILESRPAQTDGHA